MSHLVFSREQLRRRIIYRPQNTSVSYAWLFMNLALQHMILLYRGRTALFLKSIV